MSERKMEGEDSVRTVDCLRGRLLAERAASKNAKEEEQQLENKLMELEKLLKQEAKSRNKAEKKLKFLMKKLESINGSHCPDESEYISSTPSSTTKEEQESNRNQQMRISDSFESQELKGKHDLRNLKRTDTQRNGTFEGSLSSASEKWSSNMDQQSDFCCGSIRSSADESIKQRNALFEDSLSSASDQQSSINMDQQSGVCCHSIRSSADEQGQDSDSQVDDSMALVLVGSSQRTHRIDPEALDASVREVLDTLRRAKEELRSSMERRRMKVIGVAV